MPPSADPAGQQESLLNLDPIFQEGSGTRKKSPKGKKKKRKDESPPEEGAGNGGKISGIRAPESGTDKKLTPPPSSILAQLHQAQTPPHPADPPPEAPPSNISPELLEGFDAAPTRAHSSAAPAQDHTRDWASSIPYGRSPPDPRSSYGQSPPRTNGASIAGSPPTSGYYHGPIEPIRGGFSNATSPPVSPRAGFRQPARRTSDYQNLGALGTSPSNIHRRTPSMHSQNTQIGSPPPHHPQAHFYGAPELDFGVSRTRDMAARAGEGWVCKFDHISSTGQEGSEAPRNVLLVGCERGLDVVHVEKKRFDRIGHLTGLRGSAVGTKILPSIDGSEQHSHEVQPLVAIIVHGPYYPEEGAGEPQEDNDEFDPSHSTVQVPQMAEPDPNLYETTVEIYSLKSGTHIQTLFRSPKVEVEAKPYGPPAIPPPVGDLDVQARGRFIIVSSGKSGEVYVFGASPNRDKQSMPFECIGKVWTTTDVSNLSRSASVSSASDSGAPAPHDGSAAERRQFPRANLSLSSRWLAFVPPSSSSQTTLHGTAVVRGSSIKIHGLSSHTPPVEPQVTSQLDTPDAESYVNKALRDAGQTVIKGAGWVKDHGMQVWNTYWKPEPSQQPGSPPATGPLQNQQYFPPTHAQDSKAKPVRNKARLVSVLDLEKLSKSQNLKSAVALQPLATFSLPNGCGFVSFSPEGLKLLTTSAKGDVSQVWDLMRMIHGESGRFKDQNPIFKGPTVREVARFPRMTEAKIVDVVWTEPRGSRLAILTGNGTAHVFDLPQKAFQWPPPRQMLRNASTPSKPTEKKDEEAQRPQTASSSLSSAFSMLSSTTTSTIAAVRGRRPSSVTTFPTSFGGFAGVGAQGGKAVGAAVGRSVSMAAAGTYDTVRHWRENLVKLPASATEIILPGSVQWLDGGALAVTAGGLVRVYGISRSSSGKGGSKRSSVVAGKPAEFLIKDVDSSLNSTFAHDYGSRRQNDSTHLPGSFWRSTPPAPRSGAAKANTHPLSYAEIDTSAAYQPFHTDRRVNFFVYDHQPTVTDPHHLQHSSSSWVFGDSIPSTRISSGQGQTDHDDDDDGGEMENVVGAEGGQIVVTTRRKAKKDEESEEIFEDDVQWVDFAEERV